MRFRAVLIFHEKRLGNPVFAPLSAIKPKSPSPGRKPGKAVRDGVVEGSRGAYSRREGLPRPAARTRISVRNSLRRNRTSSSAERRGVAFGSAVFVEVFTSPARPSGRPSTNCRRSRATRPLAVSEVSAAGESSVFGALPAGTSSAPTSSVGASSTFDSSTAAGSSAATLSTLASAFVAVSSSGSGACGRSAGGSGVRASAASIGLSAGARRAGFRGASESNDPPRGVLSPSVPDTVIRCCPPPARRAHCQAAKLNRCG